MHDVTLTMTLTMTLTTTLCVNHTDAYNTINAQIKRRHQIHKTNNMDSLAQRLITTPPVLLLLQIDSSLCLTSLATHEQTSSTIPILPTQTRSHSSTQIILTVRRSSQIIIPTSMTVVNYTCANMHNYNRSTYIRPQQTQICGT